MAAMRQEAAAEQAHFAAAAMSVDGRVLPAA